MTQKELRAKIRCTHSHGYVIACECMMNIRAPEPKCHKTGKEMEFKYKIITFDTPEHLNSILRPLR